MSNNQQTPNSVRTPLAVVIAAILVGTGIYIWQANKASDTKNKDTKATTQQAANNTPKEDPYKGWKSFAWTAQGVTFKYPGDWFVKQDDGIYRVYVKNANADLTKEATPENFQQLWLSSDVDESSKAREDAIKQGMSDFRQVNGSVTAATIKAGSVSINTYEYSTAGGPTLEAYWTNKAGKRLSATTSTEVGEKNQQGMVANLKKVLASITLQ